MEVKLIKVVNVEISRNQDYVEVVDSRDICLRPPSDYSVYAEPVAFRSHRVPIQRVIIRDRGVERGVVVAIAPEARMLAVEPIQNEHSRSLDIAHRTYQGQIRELERKLNSLSFDRDVWIGTSKWRKLWAVLRGKDLS